MKVDINEFEIMLLRQKLEKINEKFNRTMEILLERT